MSWTYYLDFLSWNIKNKNIFLSKSKFHYFFKLFLLKFQLFMDFEKFRFGHFIFDWNFTILMRNPQKNFSCIFFQLLIVSRLSFEKFTINYHAAKIEPMNMCCFCMLQKFNTQIFSHQIFRKWSAQSREVILKIWSKNKSIKLFWTKNIEKFENIGSILAVAVDVKYHFIMNEIKTNIVK